MAKNIPLLALALLACIPFGANAQVTGGRSAFQFLTLSPAARVTALGGLQMTVRDDDVVFAAQNPAALNADMDGRLSFQHNFFLTDIQHGYAAYAAHLPKIGFTVHGGLQYVNYGDIQQADEFGYVTGKVKAGETATLCSVALTHFTT